MAPFVFVHGGYETGASFHRIAELLRAAGHSVETPDLPPNPESAVTFERVDLDAYATYVGSIVEKCGEPVVLVGHSLGGITIAAVAERMPGRVRDLVYLHALLMPPGATVRGFRESFYGVGARLSDAASERTVSDDGRYATMGAEGARTHFFGNCSLEEQEKGIKRIRKQPLAVYDEVLPTTAERWGTVRRTSVIGLRDRGLPPRFSAFMLETVGADRVEVIDSDHSSFLSTPERLASVLLGVAALPVHA